VLMERDAVSGLVIGPPQVFEGSPLWVGSARALNRASGTVGITRQITDERTELSL